MVLHWAPLLVVALVGLTVGPAAAALAPSSAAAVLAMSLAPLLAPAAVAAVDAADDAATANKCDDYDTMDETCIAGGADGGGGGGGDEGTTTTTTNKDRILTADELALHTTVENRIWLSILGKVYDVTEGVDFYGPDKGGYKYYAGRDASPCFSTGNNNDEGSEEKLEEWEDKKLVAVYEWSEFYADHETYKYLGVLGGSRYFDEGGGETPLRKDIVARSKETKKIQEEERERKRQERLARKKQKQKDKK